MAVTTNMGLKSWTLSSDLFSYTELANDWSLIDAHDHTATKGVQIPTAGIVNQAVDSTKLADNAVTTAKINDSAVTSAKIAAGLLPSKLAQGITVAGKSIIATTESRTNVAYGTLTTPDQVTGIVMPTDGLIAVAYQATWQNSAASAGAAAIFIGANQLKVTGGGNTYPLVQEATGSSTINNDNPLVSYHAGLLSAGAATPAASDVTTGQVVGAFGSGGPCYVFAAAGTYTVSVQFKSSSGSVTAKNRKLWVWAISF